MARRKQEEKQYPKIARELLDQLPIDPDGFLFDLAPNTVRDGRYWHHPVLAWLPAGEFAKTVLQASPDIQSRAIEVLHSRHDGPPVPSLLPERRWIAEVKAELQADDPIPTSVPHRAQPRSAPAGRLTMARLQVRL